MPKPSWETANNVAFFGFLKFLDFQTNGFDIHVTYQKNKQVHVSVYLLEGENKQTKVLDSMWMNIDPSGLKLNMLDWYVVMHKVGNGQPILPVPGYKSYEEFFNYESTVKAVELGIIATKPGVGGTSQKKLDLNSGWPSL
jgi:hypothetical protein